MGKRETAENFKQFDIVTDYSDHYYANGNGSGNIGGDGFTNARSCIHKSIMKEWQNLEKNLPDSICVRVYESRIDLLRAVIIGADGTPYHDGLFFFDIKFPNDYPNQPPLVKYHSHGIHLNPNLHHGGEVCLSLLNTWFGSKKKGEKWNPSYSTILQVLLSIQALVLSDKPYSNEPLAFFSSYMKSACNQYNKEVFISSCKTMLFLWRKPPKNFEGFAREHFRNRSYKILKACKDYGDGRAEIGYNDHQDDGVLQGSNDWKIMMEKVHSMLDAAFNKNQDVIPNKLPSFGTESLRQLMLVPFFFILFTVIVFLLILFGLVYLV